MKITKIDVMVLKPNLQDSKPANGRKVDWANFHKRCRPIVCRIHTDEGIFGDGEAAMLFGVGALASFGMLKDLAAMIIGMDPLDNEVIWDKLYKQAYFAQNGGPIIYSAILKGNILRSPSTSFLVVEGGTVFVVMRANSSLVGGLSLNQHILPKTMSIIL
jgi:hypothetical protein